VKKLDLLALQHFASIAPVLSAPGRFDFLAGCVVAIAWALCGFFA